MPTVIAITRDRSIEPLLDIADPEFAHQYQLGLWWALYGDEQGTGPYDDEYLISNVVRNLQAGRYRDRSSPWLTSTGFYFGMLHGGYLAKPAETLVVLTDQVFRSGYQDGRRHTGQLTDTEITVLFYTWGNSWCDWQKAPQVRHVLGHIIGQLSLTVLPLARSNVAASTGVLSEGGTS